MNHYNITVRESNGFRAYVHPFGESASCTWSEEEAVKNAARRCFGSSLVSVKKKRAGLWVATVR